MMDMQSEPPVAAASGHTKTRLADIEMQDDDDNDGKDPREMSRFETRRTLFTRIVQGVAVGAIVVNILAMFLEWSWLMLFAGLCGVGLGGGVVYYQYELRGEDSECSTVQ